MPTDAAAAKRLARYLVRKKLGRGGMGEVYGCWDPVAQRHVALKLIHGDLDDPFHRLCFEREVRTVRTVPHEHIVQLHDIGTLADRPFYTMELLSGQPWSSLLDRPLPSADEVRWTLGLFCQLLDGVHHLHRARLLHRDLKPDNIMIVPSSSVDGETQSMGIDDLIADPETSVKLMDFGLVLGFDDRPEAEENEPGTPLYMAPERHQSTGRADPRSDLYSLGVLLYQTLTRTAPFESISDAITGRRRPRDPSVIHPEIPPAIAALILEQLDPAPHRRAASAAELRTAIVTALGDSDLKGHRIQAPVFSGRVDALETLDRLASAVSAPSDTGGRLVLIDGSRDSGKTWLVHQSLFKVRLVLDHGLRYVQGTFDKQGSIHQGLRSLILDRLLEIASQVAPAEFKNRLGPWSHELLDGFDIDVNTLGDDMRPYFDALDALPEIESPELHDQHAIECAVDLLTDDANTYPIAVLLEDVHWADELDLEVLRALVRRLPRSRVLLVLTFTSHSGKAASDLEPWLAGIRGIVETEGGSGLLHEIHLEGMRDSGVERILSTMLGSSGTPSAPLVNQMVRESKGYPGAVVRGLREHWSLGHVTLEEGRWSTTPARKAPHDASNDSDGAEIYLVLDALAEISRKCLLAASMLGDEFDQRMLVEIVREEVPDTERAVRVALRELVEAGLLDSAGDVHRFNSDSIRWSCLDQLPASTRTSYHGRAARFLLESSHESANEIYPRVADHFAAAGDGERAEEYRLRGARQFSKKGALRRSLESYEALLERPDCQTPRQVLLLEVADVHHRLGDFDTALRCLEEAAEGLDDGPALLQVLENRGRILQRLGELDPADDLFRRCRDIARGDPRCAHCEPELLYSLACVQFERNAWDNATQLFEDSWERFRSADDLKGMAKVSLGLGLADMRRGHRDEAMTHIEEAIASAERAGITDVLSAALNNLSSLQRARGDNDASISSLKRSLEIRQNVGDRLGHAICVNNLSRAFWYAGDLHNAVEAARDAHDRFRELGDRKGVFFSGSNLGGFLLYRGDVEDARRVLEENLDRARKMENWRVVVDTLQSLAFLERAAGHPEEADAFFQEGLRLLPDISDASLCVTFLSVYAENCLRLGRREAAQDSLRESLDRLEEIRGREAHGWLQLSQSEFNFQDGELDEALELAEAAFQTFEATGSRLDTSLAHRQLARIYREMGPDWVDRTERHFQLASESLEAMGARMQLALTLLEEAQLWSQLDEIEESLYCLEEAARLFRECGAPRRVEQVEQQIESLNA